MKYFILIVEPKTKRRIVMWSESFSNCFDALEVAAELHRVDSGDYRVMPMLEETL